MGEGAAHQQVVEQARDHAGATDGKCRMPAVALLDPGREQHRHGRADVDRHVIDGERRIDAGVVAFVDAPYQIGGVGLEQPVADDDHAERRIQEGQAVRRQGEQQVAERKNCRADAHRASRTEDLVADPAADRRRRIHQRGKRAPGQVCLLVVEAELLDHEQHQQRGHAVIAEALPQFDQEYRAEGTGLAGAGGSGVWLEGVHAASVWARSGKLRNDSMTALSIRTCRLRLRHKRWSGQRRIPRRASRGRSPVRRCPAACRRARSDCDRRPRSSRRLRSFRQSPRRC